MKTYGTREEVYNGLAKKTRGGLTPNDIIKRGDKLIRYAVIISTAIISIKLWFF